jgi:NAD(P)-dependent dehydrogenase (short-subunit alcohol dehydrogenase family)
MSVGVIFNGDVEGTFPQDFDYLMDINIRTPFILTQFFQHSLMNSDGKQGCVVNVSCISGQNAQPGQIGYCMVKAGLDMFTKSAAMELAPFGIRVNAVAPTYTDTNLYRYAGLNKDEYDSLKVRAASNIPMQRIGKDHEVAKAIIYLTSEK